MFSRRIDNLPSGLGLYAETIDIQLTCAGDLLDKFNSAIDPADPITAKPLASVLNPENKGIRYHPFEDVWLFFYRQGFRVHVIKHFRWVSGPHPCRLYYQSWQTRQIFWIATLQIEAMFYSEDAIQMNLTLAILDHQFYIADKSRKTIVSK